MIYGDISEALLETLKKVSWNSHERYDTGTTIHSFNISATLYTVSYAVLIDETTVYLQGRLSLCEGKIWHPPEMQQHGYKGKMYGFLRNFEIEEKLVLVQDFAYKNFEAARLHYR